MNDNVSNIYDNKSPRLSLLEANIDLKHTKRLKMIVNKDRLLPVYVIQI